MIQVTVTGCQLRCPDVDGLPAARAPTHSANPGCPGFSRSDTVLNIQHTASPSHGQAGVSVQFWGVRGSIPTPRADSARYGGNTTCLQICIPGFEEQLVIDAGSGIREFGRTLSPESRIHLLLSHFHWDHLQGLPFFAPLYSPESHILFYSDREKPETEAVLRGQMSQPYFPTQFEAAASTRNYLRYPAVDNEFRIGPAAVRPIPLQHPQGALGFRIEVNGTVLVHICDHEHGNLEIDRGIVAAAENADLLIYDAQFTPEEYESHRGWGHSTMEEGIRMAKQSGARRLLFTHHDAEHDDVFIDELVSRARESFENLDAAREFTLYAVNAGQDRGV
jgi:phosphoribosyl 1,2-cyclic phosphodiesterase